MTAPFFRSLHRVFRAGLILGAIVGFSTESQWAALGGESDEWSSVVVESPPASTERPRVLGKFLAFPVEEPKQHAVAESVERSSAWDEATGNHGIIISDGAEPEAIVETIELPPEPESVFEATGESDSLQFRPSLPSLDPLWDLQAFRPLPTGHFREWLRCKLEGCWTTRFDALLLWRSAPQSRPLYTTRDPVLGDLGPTILDGDQLESDPFAGGRVSLIHCRPNGYAFETTYLYAGTSYAERSLPYLEDSYALAAPGMYSNPWGNEPGAPPISAVQSKLLGQLQSLEFNYREPIWHGLAKFIVGLRWVQWQESFLMADQFIDALDRSITGSDLYDTSCINDMYGGQLGIDAVLYARPSGVRVEGLVKAGAYWNNAMQRSFYNYQTTQPFQFTREIRVGTPRSASFVGEVNLTAVLPLRSNLDFRVGYVGLWVQGIAQPINQLSGQNLSQQGPIIPPTGTLTSNGQVLVQGLSLGLEGRW